MAFFKNDNGGPLLNAGVVKVAVVGEPQVGKTSFIRSFYDHHKPDEIFTDNGVIVYLCKFEVNKMEGSASIFEIPGNDDFKEQRMRYYEEVRGIVFMYASDNPTSLEMINEKWLPEAKDIINSNRTSVVLVGTKKDLQQDQQGASVDEFQVTREEGKKLFERHQILSSKLFLEYSTDDLVVVNQAFNFMFDFALFNRRLRKWMQLFPSPQE